MIQRWNSFNFFRERLLHVPPVLRYNALKARDYKKYILQFINNFFQTLLTIFIKCGLYERKRTNICGNKFFTKKYFFFLKHSILKHTTGILNYCMNIIYLLYLHLNFCVGILRLRNQGQRHPKLAKSCEDGNCTQRRAPRQRLYPPVFH